jgi:hypothetical protein
MSSEMGEEDAELTMKLMLVQMQSKSRPWELVWERHCLYYQASYLGQQDTA